MDKLNFRLIAGLVISLIMISGGYAFAYITPLSILNVHLQAMMGLGAFFFRVNSFRSFYYFNNIF
jgi:hypothetical protein